MSASWETAFVAVSVIVGEPLDGIPSALTTRADSPADELLRRLADPSKEVRARALARVVADVALAIEALDLARSSP